MNTGQIHSFTRLDGAQLWVLVAQVDIFDGQEGPPDVEKPVKLMEVRRDCWHRGRAVVVHRLMHHLLSCADACDRAWCCVCWRMC